MSSSYLLFLIKKYHHFEYMVHRFYIILFAMAIIGTSGYHLYVDFVDFTDGFDSGRLTHALIAF
jgi:hypothetical protein